MPADQSLAPRQVLRLLQAGAPGLDPAGPVRLIETSASWVYLLRGYVLKQKKPVAGRVIDLTTLAARERNARRELAINQVFSPDVYLSLRVACRRRRGGLRMIEPGALRDDDEPMDWFVLMRRLPQSRMLDQLIRRGHLSPEQIDGLAKSLLLAHSAARPTRIGTLAWLARFEREQRRCRALFSAHEKRLELQALALTEQAGRRLQQALKERFGQGAIIQAHGDLRPAHVCLQAEPRIIDALDGNAVLRQLDPWEDLALLGLECALSGAAWVSERLGRCYGQLAPLQLAYPGGAINAYYRAHHAVVRARLALAHLDASRGHRRRDWAALCGRYAAEAWVAAEQSLALG
ncbi:MAG: hypothetical protein RI906_3699 [Pseudomonadota bacterium]|jgi:aminoglycoside phosphotransferase family enzyme